MRYSLITQQWLRTMAESHFEAHRSWTCCAVEKKHHEQMTYWYLLCAVVAPEDMPYDL